MRPTMQLVETILFFLVCGFIAFGAFALALVVSVSFCLCRLAEKVNREYGLFTPRLTQDDASDGKRIDSA